MSVESANLPNSVGNNQNAYGWQNYTAPISDAPKKPANKKKMILVLIIILVLGVSAPFAFIAITNAIKEANRTNSVAEKALYKTDKGNKVAEIEQAIASMQFKGKTSDEILAYLDSEIANMSDEDFKVYIQIIRADYIGGYIDNERSIEELKALENKSDKSYVKEAVYNKLKFAYRRKKDEEMAKYYEEEAEKYR